MFSALGIEITPQPGVLLIWNNALPDGCPNDATLHAGLPVERGAKYVITKWYRTCAGNHRRSSASAINCRVGALP
ncbi:hypothetical protein ABIE62_000665 [Porphyrobacter sp. MBR-155]|jgi:prolyl 4-hydroxylase